MKKRTRVLVGIGIIIVAMGALLALGFSKSQTYYVTLHELLAKPASADRQLRVNGKLVGASVAFDPAKVMLTFKITNGKEQLPVAYNGVKPGNFEDGYDVLVEGKYRNGTFQADNLLTKCPSKYEAKVKQQQN